MSKIRAVLFAVVGVGVCLAAAAGSARATALPAATQSAVASYGQELIRVEKAKSRVSLEPLFMMAYSMRDALVTPVSSGAPSPMEALTEDEFAAAQGTLRGMLVNRDEAVFAVPDAEFFEKLGERKGSTEDRLLLRLYHRTYAGSPWPIYIRQQTDYSGCTDYGPGNLTKLYGEWLHYRSLHPTRYKAVVDEELSRIEDELTHATCACGPSGSVQSELRYFLHRHPGSPIAPAVRARLNELLHGASKIRFNCVSG